MSIVLKLTDNVPVTMQVRFCGIVVTRARGPQVRLLGMVDGVCRSVYVPTTVLRTLEAEGAERRVAADGVTFYVLPPLRREWRIERVRLPGYPPSFELAPVVSRGGGPVPIWSASPPRSLALSGSSS
jgi:hypothetical protein